MSYHVLITTITKFNNMEKADFFFLYFEVEDSQGITLITFLFEIALYPRCSLTTLAQDKPYHELCSGI